MCFSKSNKQKNFLNFFFKLVLVGVLKVSDKIVGSGSATGSISQRYGYKMSWIRNTAFKEPWDRFQGIDFAILCRLADGYNSPIPTRFLAPVDCSKIPALYLAISCVR